MREHDRLRRKVTTRVNCSSSAEVATSPRSITPPPRLALRRRDLVPDEGLSNVEAAIEKFHVLPAKPKQLAPTVGKGAVLGLGDYNPFSHESAVVDGNVTAHQPETLYLGGMTVHGNVVSNGGGNPASERNFPFKDNTVDGNVIIQGWHGFWFGVIRVTVGGNVIVAKTSGTQVGLPDTDFEGILDSTEVVSNVIEGNLICHGNRPPAQIGDAILDPGNGSNTVGGNAIGECADLAG